MTDLEPRKTLLEIEGLTLHYGAAQALFGIDLRVAAGETVAIVGANGAGKSSLLRAITGLVPPSGGRVLLDGQDVTGHPPSRMAALGVTLSPEGREMFSDLSVRENLVLGALASAPDKAELGRRLEEVFRRFPKLRERSGQPTATLSGGEQQMVAIGRALHGPATAPAPGRAEPGPRAAGDRRDLRHHPPARPRGDDDPPGGTERRPRAHGVRHGPSPGQRSDRPLGKERGAAGPPGAAPRVPGGGVQEQPGPESSGGRRSDQYPTGEARHEQTVLHAPVHLRGRPPGPPACGPRLDRAARPAGLAVLPGPAGRRRGRPRRHTRAGGRREASLHHRRRPPGRLSVPAASRSRTSRSSASTRRREPPASGRSSATPRRTWTTGPTSSPAATRWPA